MKNEHLVPVNVADIVQRLSEKGLRENERMNLVLRLEAIRDYAAAAVAKHSRAPTLVQTKK
jgi:hypothetical protein